ncbi:DUF6461 domain-containing protein [Actinokineospora sp. G85]|uniref:DUF6461 domain-containing protein n=1 Tax=Actinokineospora sp. G85 TaxID=3406626 RepID=UPI003C72A2E4
MPTTPQDSSADWNWLGPLFEYSGCLTFARGMIPEEMLRAFDLDPATAEELTLDETMRTLGVPGFDDPPFWVRAAELGEWSVAIELGQAKGYLDGIETDLSIETEVLTMVFLLVKPPQFRLLDRYGVVTDMTLGEGYETRSGAEPHALDPALAEAGLLDFTTHPSYGTAFSRAAAAIATQLEIDLDADTFTGPMLTATRDHPYVYGRDPLTTRTWS